MYSPSQRETFITYLINTITLHYLLTGVIVNLYLSVII